MLIKQKLKKIKKRANIDKNKKLKKIKKE